MVSAMLHEFCVKRGEEQGKGPLKVVNKQTKNTTVWKPKLEATEINEAQFLNPLPLRELCQKWLQAPMDVPGGPGESCSL